VLPAQTPVSLIVFDLTHLDRQSTTELHYTQRGALLAQLAFDRDVGATAAVRRRPAQAARGGQGSKA